MAPDNEDDYIDQSSFLGHPDDVSPEVDGVRERYAAFLGGLLGLAHDLGLDDEPPTDYRHVPAGLDRPEDGLVADRGAAIPLYPKDETGPNGVGFARTVFNLMALTGVDLRRDTQRGRRISGKGQKRLPRG